MFRREVDLETVSHVEHLVHFRPVSSALLMDSPEKRRYREQVILYHTHIISYKMQYLGLRTA